MKDLRVLTVQQPWATLIVRRFKPVENRERNIAGNYRGPVAILAGLKVDKGARAVEAARKHLGDIRLDDCERGGIIGICELVDVVTAESSHPCVQSWWFVGPVGLVLADAKSFPVIPARGLLSLTRATEELKQQIMERLNAN